MPIIKSAKKRMKQAEARKVYNTRVKNSVKSQAKVVNAQIQAGDVKNNAELIKAISELDRAVKKGVLHKKTADRRKSRLTKRYNEVASKPFGTESPGKPGAKSAKKTVAKKPVAKKAAIKKATKPVAKKPTTKTKKPTSKK